MIDFFKAIVVDSNIDLPNSKFNFTQKFNVETAEVNNYYEGEYNSLKVRLYENGFMIVSGSLHKFHNKGVHNANQFNLRMINESLEEVCELLCAPLEHITLQTLEFGLNLYVPFNPKIAIDGFMYHLGKLPETRFNGFYKEFKHNEYSLKLYSKSYHYELPKDILRCELKMVKSRWFNHRFNIQNMNDLKDINKLELMKDELINKIEEAIQCYPLNPLIIINCDWSNSLYWASLEKRKRYQERQSFEQWKSKQEPEMPPLDRLICHKFKELTNSLFV